MKRASLFVVLALLASPVLASYTAQMTDLPPVWSGGPFQVVLNGTGPEGSFSNYTFPTFCVEKGAHVTLPGTYVATINDDVQTGAWDVGGPYPTLQLSTKQLYHSYLMLANPTDADGVAYQKAIWNSQSGASFDTTLILANATGNGVKVLNLWGQVFSNRIEPQTDHQSQLVMVPAPGAILLGSLGMGLVGWLRRGRSL